MGVAHSKETGFRFEDSLSAGNRYEIIRSCLPPHIRDGLPHVADMVSELLIPLNEAMIKAAELGQGLWLQTLVARPGCVVTIDVAVAAAVHGHLEAVEIAFGRDRYDEITMAWKVLKASGARGQLKIVEFASRVLLKKAYSYGRTFRDWTRQSKALSAAITGGFLNVVESLLNSKHFRWDYASAFAQAVAEQQDAISEFMCENFDSYSNVDIEFWWDDPDSLLVLLARDGYMEAVKYLFGHQDHSRFTTIHPQRTKSYHPKLRSSGMPRDRNGRTLFFHVPVIRTNVERTMEPVVEVLFCVDLSWRLLLFPRLQDLRRNWRSEHKELVLLWRIYTAIVFHATWRLRNDIHFQETTAEVPNILNLLNSFKRHYQFLYQHAHELHCNRATVARVLQKLGFDPPENNLPEPMHHMWTTRT